MNGFAKRFKDLREEQDLTQEELLSDYNRIYHRNYRAAAISYYENGKRMPEIDALKDFADYFGVSVSYLLGDSDVRDPDGRYAHASSGSLARENKPNIPSAEEQEVIKAMRTLINNGSTWRAINSLLRLSPEAAHIAGRWEALNDDSRAVVRSALVSEERRYLRGEASRPTKSPPGAGGQ